uniref:RING-type domain-containing protein n=1 Tax=Acrobeloides nanus TaxID=290746 RepID=A0A914CKS9_9BILA
MSTASEATLVTAVPCSVNECKSPGDVSSETTSIIKPNMGFVNPLQKIEELLTCPICLDRYKQPKLLPCQHTFCLPCLDSYADTVLRNLKCPECRAEHQIPFDGVKSFQTNYTLTGFLDIHLEASDENSAELAAYIQRYNLERCRICDEKAELELCPHCERRACVECRSNHMEMVKRDIGRLLNQVRRLNNRIKDAAASVNKSVDLLKMTAETTKTEVHEYFHRYYRELKRREENLIADIDTFHETELRLMTNLKDVLEVENNNIHDACAWLDAVLNGSKEVKDDELYRMKNVFVEGLEYLRNFQPDAEELFGKKIRFSPGDDASKLPAAIASFGELSVSTPQFSGRYMALEQQYLPRPFRIGLESDSFKISKRAELDDGRVSSRYSKNTEEDAGIARFRRRQQLEDEARNRLRVGTESGRSSPMNGYNSSGHSSPWRSPVVGGESESQNPEPIANHETNKNPESKTRKNSRDQSKEKNQRKVNGSPQRKVKKEKKEPVSEVPSSNNETVTTGNNSTGTGNNEAGPSVSSSNITETATPATQPEDSAPKNEPPKQEPPTEQPLSENIMTTSQTSNQLPPSHRKPPLPRQTSSSDDPLLNDKIESIRQAHEERIRQRFNSISAITSGDEENHSPVRNVVTRIEKVPTDPSLQQNSDTGKATQRFRILCRSSPRRQNSKPEDDVNDDKPLKKEDYQPIPIEHFTENSTMIRYVPLPRQDSSGENSASASASATESESSANPITRPTERRSRFRRRSSIVPDREMSADGSLTRISERRATAFRGSPGLSMIDYGSKSSPKSVFGRKGDKPSEMNWPRGIAVMPGGEFAVCDSSNHRVQIFNASGRLIKQFGVYGTEDGELDSCAGIAYHRYRQQLVVSDRYNHRIQMFDLDGKYVKQFGGLGVADGRFNNPWGVCVNEMGLIYVVDKDNHRVQIFDQNGNFMSKFGSGPGEGIGQFNHPLFITIHKRSQNIYVSDSANHRICVFDHDGVPILNFGIEGFHTGQLKLPRGIAVDDQGYVIIADSGNNRVQVFSPDGKFVHGFGAWGAGAGQLKGIEAVALMDTQIIVSDRENHRIQIF